MPLTQGFHGYNRALVGTSLTAQFRFRRCVQYDAEVRMDTETAELVEPCDELPSDWELKLAELKLMQLSTADLDEVSRGQSSIAILD